MGCLRKKGLSPVIATVLLISMALVLAIIIFIWARSHVQEQIEKENQNIELVCGQTSFVAEAFAGTRELWIENTGSVALWGVEVRIKRTGEVAGAYEFKGESGAGSYTVNPGQTKKMELTSYAQEGDTIIVSPILLGKSKTRNDRVPHICDVEYGVEAIVGA